MKFCNVLSYALNIIPVKTIKMLDPIFIPGIEQLANNGVG